LTRSKSDVICAGILVADIFAPPLPRLPDEGELLPVDDFLLQLGGCAANTGVDLVKLGVRTAVVGKVGDDIFAEFALRYLEDRGLDVSGVRVSSAASTSKTVILPVTGQDRRYIHTIGANADFGIDDVDLEQVDGARVLYVGGYLLLPGLEQAALAQLFQFARQRGIKTVLDVAGVRPEEGIEPLRQVLPYTDVFLPNDDEGRLITGEVDPVRQARIFVERGAGTAVVTLGGAGAVACTSEQGLRVSAYPVAVIDPSGGGDAFDAGWIVGLLEGWSLRRTIEFASAIGASACTRSGCTAGVFTRDEAEAFLAQNQIEIREI
jgi:sugar/nucleoside kinase (ribokinase family)